MKRFFLILFLLLWTSLFGAVDQCLVELLQRKDVVQLARISEALERFSDDPMIVTLQELHVKCVQEYHRPLGATPYGPLEARIEFDPRWLFKPGFSGYLNDLVAHLFPEESSTHVPPTPRVWTKKWEDAFLRHGGALATKWTQAWGSAQKSGRDRFVEHLMLELAYRYQKSQGVGAQPGRWTDERFSPFYADSMQDPILGNLAAFQKLYDPFHRRKEVSRAPRTNYASQAFYRRNRAAMVALGISDRGFRQWAPSRSAWESLRERQHQLEVMEASIRHFGNSQTPLAGVFVRPDGGDGTSQFQWQFADRLFSGIGESASSFMSALNTRLSPDYTLSRGVGASNWAQEFLIQGGLVYLIDFPDAKFQINSPSQAHYVDPRSTIWQASRFRRINALQSAIELRAGQN